jgi:hypothetical protein
MHPPLCRERERERERRRRGRCTASAAITTAVIDTLFGNLFYLVLEKVRLINMRHS